MAAVQKGREESKAKTSVPKSHKSSKGLVITDAISSCLLSVRKIICQEGKYNERISEKFSQTTSSGVRFFGVNFEKNSKLRKLKQTFEKNSSKLFKNSIQCAN